MYDRFRTIPVRAPPSATPATGIFTQRHDDAACRYRRRPRQCSTVLSTYASNHGTKPSASLFVESHLECMFLSVAKAAPCTAHATAVPPPRVPRAQPAPSPGQIATSAPDRPASDPVRAPHHDDDLASLAASPVTRTLGSCCGGGRPARRASEGTDALGPERP